MTHYDVIIIGTGAGGGTLAYQLAPSGKTVLLIERGDYVRREQDNWSSRAVNVDRAGTRRIVCVFASISLAFDSGQYPSGKDAAAISREIKGRVATGSIFMPRSWHEDRPGRSEGPDAAQRPDPGCPTAW